MECEVNIAASATCETALPIYLDLEICELNHEVHSSVVQAYHYASNMSVLVSSVDGSRVRLVFRPISLTSYLGKAVVDYTQKPTDSGQLDAGPLPTDIESL